MYPLPWRGPKSRPWAKKCAPLRRHSASRTQNQGPECFHRYLAHGSRFCKIQQLQVAFAIKRSSLNPATFPYPRPHPFPYQDQSIAPPSRPKPQLRHLAAANLICWAAPLVVYIPLGPLHLSYSLTFPYPIHPFSSFLFFPSSQSSKQHRQDVWPSSRLHRLCRQNPRWFFLGVRNCCCSLARTILVLKTQSSSLSGLTATQLGSAAIKGLSIPSFIPDTCIRI